MSEEYLPLSERLLMIMHNLCVTSRNTAKKSKELVQFLQTNVDEINQILNRHESEGYITSFSDNEEERRYYLTGVGIIRVCSLFT